MGKGVIGVINTEKVVNGNQIHSELQWKAVDLTSYICTQPLTAVSHTVEQCIKCFDMHYRDSY